MASADLFDLAKLPEKIASVTARAALPAFVDGAEPGGAGRAFRNGGQWHAVG